MFTFQDNFLNRHKFQFLDEKLSRMNIKSVTLRNLTYFMWPKCKIDVMEGEINEFERIKKTKMEFIFVWEKHSVHYNSR